MPHSGKGVRPQRVLIIGGSTLSRVMIESALIETAEFDVAGVTDIGSGIADLVDEVRPDLIIIDPSAKAADGERLADALLPFASVRKVVLVADAATDLRTSGLAGLARMHPFTRGVVAEDRASFRRFLLGIAGEGCPAPIDRADHTSAGGIAPPPAPGALSPVAAARPIGEVLPAEAPRVLDGAVGIAHEEARLLALAALRIANFDADRRLDVITRHLCRTSGYPMAAVTLIDDAYQWIKSAHGLPTGRMTREQAICTHALAYTTPLIVSDTVDHPVFAQLDCVRGDPGIRSYIGMPLIVNGNLAIGAVCLIDTQPRPLIQREIPLLMDMAELIVTMLDPAPLPLVA